MTICHPSKGKFIVLDYMSYICHACTKLKIGSPIQGLLHWNEMMGNEERGQREAHCQKEVENIRGEVARLRSAWTSVEHQMERECLHNLLWEHCSSTSHWSCTSPFQSWTTTTMPSVITNDNFCSRSIALLIVHRLHIFQWHQITTSLLCMVH